MDIYLDAIKPDISVLDKNLREFPVEVKREGYILIHPFAGWKAKEWNFNKYILLSRMLNAKYNLKFISHPGGIDDLIQQELTAQDIEVVICMDVYELIKVINSGTVIISNDSGPIYIASMLGKPTFTIYGPTNPDFSFPFGPYHQFTRKKIKCSPEKDQQYCFTNAGRQGCPSFECMNDFMVEDVYKEIESFLDELNIKQKSHATSLNKN
jgi:heptosyltransferase-2